MPSQDRLNLWIPPHRIYQSPQHYNLTPIKQNQMQWIYGTLSITCFTLLNIFNKFDIDNWKSILSLIGGLVMLVMWMHGKTKDRKHKNRMQDLEYRERLYELDKKIKNEYDPKEDIGI